MFLGECAGNFRQRSGDLVRLGGQNQNRRGFGEFKIGPDGLRAEFAVEIFSRGVKRIGGEKLVRFDEFGVLMKPCASAVAILPAPRGNPIFNGAAMRVL